MGVLFHSHSRRNFLDHNSIVLIVLVVRKMHFALESMVLVSMTFHNKLRQTGKIMILESGFEQLALSNPYMARKQVCRNHDIIMMLNSK